MLWLDDLLIDKPGLVISIVAILVVATYSVIRQQLTTANKPWKTVPGGWPLLGHFYTMAAGGRIGFVQTLEKWADQYGAETGCFEFEVMGTRILVVCREDAAKEILSQRPFNVTRSTNLREAVKSLGATGVFSAEGEQWKQERKLISSTLNKIHMQDYVPTLKDSAIALIQKWEVDAKESPDGVISIKQDLGHAPADTVGKVFVGRDFDFLHNPESDMGGLVNQGFKALSRRVLAPIKFWKIPFIGQDLDGFGKYFRSGMATLSQVIKDYEQERAANPKANSKTFIAKLYDVMEQEKSKLDHERIVGNIVTAFAAGTDTTSLTLLSTLHFLAENKELQAELREHIRDFDLETATLDDYYTKVPVLKSFLHEIHRYYCTPIMGLQPAKDIPFCGTTLPKGSRVLIFLRHIMLQQKSPAEGVPTGPDNAPPQVFSYRRYLVPADENTTTSKEQKWQCIGPLTKGFSFLPFGHGVRTCPGRLYSEILSYAILIKLLQTFEFELAPNHL
ncbi:synthase [Seminavis robusta]|uniref:Synthase n=1 Tax=Seminavis robusta TaxID=568900 RepID=A0A9N8HH58_9STRA|nr:synthase [Seminavis robusta]|eukprot:Sro544_g163720.1 synthase (505) ;mRNA; f:53325-54923